MQKQVETLLGRLATDPAYRARFAVEPRALLTELVELGVELTEVECAALAATDPEALQAFAASLDPRLQRVVSSLPPTR